MTKFDQRRAVLPISAIVPPSFLPVRGPATGRLWFMFDPARNLVQIKQGRVTEIIDLNQYHLFVRNEK